MKMRFTLTIAAIMFSLIVNAQTAIITGVVASEHKPVPYASIVLKETNFGAISNNSGRFEIRDIPEGDYTIRVSFMGYDSFEQFVSLKKNDKKKVHIPLIPKGDLLNEVVVTGVSKATLIREDPVPITSISAKQIEQTTESNIIDVLVKNVPGLNAVKTGANISKPFIRGLGYNRVLTLYDGIRQEGQQWGDEHGIEIDNYNIGKAEVIKGPSSLMYGSDALAGVISFFPHIPEYYDKKVHGRFISEYQTNNNLIGSGLRLGYNSEHLLWEVRGSYRMAKNYRNPVDGRVYLTNFDEKNLSVLLGYKTDKGSTHFSFTLYDNHQAIPDGSRDSLTRKFTKQIFEGERDIIRNRPVVSDAALNSYKIPALSQHIQHYRLYINSLYQLGQGDISFLLAGQQNNRREFNHPTIPEQAGMDVQLNTLNYGLRYNAPKFSKIETTIGINGMAQENKNKDATDFPIPDYNLFDFGTYLYTKWKHNDWTVSGGVRYDIRHEKWNDFYMGINPETGFDQQVDANAKNAELPFPTFEKTFQNVSASLGATYKVSKEISLKANIGRAFRAPNITELASNGLDPGAHIIYLGDRSFNPEFSLQEDIGVSARFEDFSADVSLYNNNIRNYIYLNLVVDKNGNPVVDAQENRTYQYQQSTAQLYGSEVWFAIHPKILNGFRFDNSLAVVYGYNRDKTFKGEGKEGEYLPLIPPLKLRSSISQTIKPSSKWFFSLTPKVEMEYAATQDRYLGLNNTETQTFAYTLVNLGIVTEIKYSKNQTIQLQLQVNNLFDEAYQSHLSRLKYFEYNSQSPTEHLGIYNMGRNVALKVVVPF